MDIGQDELQLLARSEAVRLRIDELKDSLMERSLELGRLLREARDNDYHVFWGYPRFGSWIEEESGLDMSERNAYYLISIVERSEQLGIPDEQLKRVKLSKLKEIFKLTGGEQDELVKQLVTEAETAPLSTIKEAVAVATGSEFTYLNLKLPRVVRDDVVLPAFERIRREFGNTINAEGELKDIPDWRCLEFACAEIMSMPQEQETDVVDAEYADVVEEVYRDGSQAWGMGDR